MYYRKHKPQRDYRKWIAVAMGIVTILLILVDIRLKPVMRTAIEERTKLLVTQAVNSAVSDVLSRSGMTYSDFVELTTASDGSVMSVQTNSTAVNMFKAQVSEAVISELAAYENIPAEIPIGSLTGINMLAGSGMGVRLNMKIDGGLTTDLESNFTQAGINQTLHSIDCVVEADIYAVIPGMSTPVRVSTNVMIAQSVIVGETPESFTYVYGDQSDDIGRVFDYGDPYGEDVGIE